MLMYTLRHSAFCKLKRPGCGTILNAYRSLLVILIFNSCSTSVIRPQEQGDRVINSSEYPRAYQLLKVSEDDVPEVNLGTEFSKYSKTKKGGNPGANKNESNVAEKVLLYLPNRLLDLWDIFRVDLGVGPATGAVLRITKYGQVGYRTFSPASIRVGLNGRNSPIFMENENEFGIGPGFIQSSKRKVSASEVGAGVDLLLVGAYLGIDFLEIADFFTGIFTIDLKHDDL